MIKIIHCADLHLDSAMTTHMTDEKASSRNTEIINTFIRMTKYAVKNGVKVIIIAGDMFDCERVRTRTIDEVLDAIQRTQDIDYLYLVGNHARAVKIFRDHKIPKNLKFFGREWTTYIYNEVAVSGVEIDRSNSSTLYSHIPYEDDMFNIVVMHGQVGVESGVDRIDIDKLKNKGIDYLALGHIHARSENKLDDKGVYCYSGCLEGRGFDECGPKGFMLITVDDRLKYEFVPFSYRQLHKVDIDITGLTKNTEVRHKMEEYSHDISSKDMVEFILSGGMEPASNIDIQYLQDIIKDKFFFVKVKDETHLSINPDDYKNDISLKGEFIRSTLRSNMDDNDKKDIIRTGIQALMGEEFTL